MDEVRLRTEIIPGSHPHETTTDVRLEKTAREGLLGSSIQGDQAPQCSFSVAVSALSIRKIGPQPPGLPVIAGPVFGQKTFEYSRISFFRRGGEFPAQDGGRHERWIHLEHLVDLPLSLIKTLE